MTTESGTLIPAPRNHRCTRKVPGAGGSPQALPLQTRSTRAAVMPEPRLQSSAGMGPQRGSRSPLWRAVSQAGKFKRLTPQDRNVFQAPTSWHTSAAGQDGGDWWVILVNPALQLHALPVSSSASPGPAQPRGQRLPTVYLRSDESFTFSLEKRKTQKSGAFLCTDASEGISSRFTLFCSEGPRVPQPGPHPFEAGRFSWLIGIPCGPAPDLLI